ncbi:type III secretion system protein [Pseudomonas sp. D1-1]|uniref:type III secretion system protein n=1 Tax=Pseudomonas sp. D1-1 TaxID=1040793 RepID=UPI003DA89124
MKKLSLRRLSSTASTASLALGRGRFLEFTSGAEQIRMTLGPLAPWGVVAGERHTGFSSRHGPLLLSNANALLSLCGEVPVLATEPPQAWYWQLINQQLAPGLCDLLAPLEPLADEPLLDDRQQCRVLIERGAETAYGVLSLGAATLLQVLDNGPWRFIEHVVPEHWALSHPVIVGRMDLLANELRSLRPGDVLLPTDAVFDIQGRGNLQLGHQRWSVCTEDRNDHLQLRLIHEEGSINEQ